MACLEMADESQHQRLTTFEVLNVSPPKGRFSASVKISGMFSPNVKFRQNYLGGGCLKGIFCAIMFPLLGEDFNFD